MKPCRIKFGTNDHSCDRISSRRWNGRCQVVIENSSDSQTSFFPTHGRLPAACNLFIPMLANRRRRWRFFHTPQRCWIMCRSPDGVSRITMFPGDGLQGSFQPVVIRKKLFHGTGGCLWGAYVTFLCPANQFYWRSHG